MTATHAPTPSVIPAAVADVYLVALSGGWQHPSFIASTDLAKAKRQYDTWVECSEEGDIVTLVHQSIRADGTVMCVKTAEQAAPTPDGDEG